MMGTHNLRRSHHHVVLCSAGLVEVSSMLFAISRLLLVFDHCVRIHHSVRPPGHKQLCPVAFLESGLL